MNRSVVVFLSVFAGLYGFLHYFTAAFLSNNFTYYGVEIGTVFTLGFILTFVAYYLGSRKPGGAFYSLAWAGYIWMGTFFISFSICAVLALIEALFEGLPNLSVPALVLSALLSAYSLFRGLQFPRIRIEKVEGPAEFKGLKYVQITDLHVGLLKHNQGWLQKVVDQVNRLQPDFLFLTGDLVEGKWDYVRPQLEPLKSAQAKTAKIYISGNHEMIHGGIVWEKELAEKGWTVLHNQNQVYTLNGAKLLVAGIPDRMIKRFDPRFESNPDKALSTTENVSYRILLAHEPSSVFDIKAQKPDILLSGHTHGGQIFPFHGLVRAVQPVVAGWKTISGVRVYAHIGTGLWGPPMRLGTRNEIVVFEMV